MGLLNNMSLGRRGIKYKMLVAFALVSIIPLLTMAYFVVNYVFSGESSAMVSMTAIILFVLWGSWAGYILAKESIAPVVDLASDTKMIANGEYDKKIQVNGDDELSEIAKSINIMTDKMRNHLGELQEYSEETAALNVKIHRKVFTITNLMKLGDLISTGSGFREVAGFAAERLAGELYNGFCTIFIKEDLNMYTLRAVLDNSDTGGSISDFGHELPSLEKHFMKNDYLLVDSRSQERSWQVELRKKMNRLNIIIFPMKIKSVIIGVIAFGNFGEGVVFEDEDIEVIRAFEKELVLGYQSSKVIEKVKGLEVVDTVTGVYTFSYLKDRMEDEINRAIYYQRPCSFLIVSVVDFEKYRGHHGEVKAHQRLKQIGEVLTGVVPPVGKVARGEQGEFGMLLPEMNKREAFEVAETVCEKIEEMKSLSKADDRATVSVGVGENPIDGSNAEEIISHARRYAAKANEEGKNKIVGE